MLLLLLFCWGVCLSQSDLAKKTIEIAKTYNGATETKSNSSPIIDKFIIFGGGVPGWSWCMYFIYYCVAHAAIYLDEAIPLLRTGSCSAQLRYCYNLHSNKVKVFLVKDTFVQPEFKLGQIYIMKHGADWNSKKDLKKDWLGHVFDGIKKEGHKITTIEGNTNPKGSRTGGMVCINQRDDRNNEIVAIIQLN